MSEINFNSTLLKIKNRGYWMFRTYPTEKFEISDSDLSDLKKSIRDLSVKLRGWYFPHCPGESGDNSGLYRADNKIQSFSQSGMFNEVWNIYSSGQFIDLLGLREDWYSEDKWFSPDSVISKIEPGTTIEVVGSVIYSITEFYLFASELYKYLDCKSITIELALNNANFLDKDHRKLNILDPGRFLFSDYKFRGKNIVFPTMTFNTSELSERFLDIAGEQIMFLFRQFNWDAVSADLIRTDQEKLIQKRI